MPKFFHIRDKIKTRLTRAQHSKSSNVPLQTQVSNAGSAPQRINSGTRSLNAEPVAEFSQEADASIMPPTGSHGGITRSPAEPARVVASDEPVISQLPPQSNTSQSVGSDSRAIPPLTPLVVSTHTAHGLGIFPPISVRNDTKDPEWQAANSDQLATSGDGNAPGDTSDDAQSHHLSWLAREQRGVAYEGFKTILRGINDSAVMCPPLKTAAAALLSVITAVDLAVSNKRSFEDMEQQFHAILAIFERYKDYRRESILEPHLGRLSKSVNHNELTTRLGTLFRNRDTGLIVQIFRDIGIALQTFQANISLSILERQAHDTITLRLKPANHASYDTRHGAEHDVVLGCMEGTRADILKDLEDWAEDVTAPKVYWLSGMAGTGKSSIAHTLCEILDKKGTLGGTFFCSRSDAALSDWSRIIPTLASMLAESMPQTRSKLYQVLEDKPEAALLNAPFQQFDLLVAGPAKSVIEANVKTWVVVIDAIDECSQQEKVESLITTICEGVSGLPLKFFISSRPEALIEMAFDPYVHVTHSLTTVFPLHDVAEEDVRRDIEMFLRSSLSKVAQRFKCNTDWPSEQELTALLDRSGRLFIYAAIAVRYIRASPATYRQRLTAMTRPGFASPLQTGRIDSFYSLIMEEGFRELEMEEMLRRREVLSAVVFLRAPLSIQGIGSLMDYPEDDIRGNLWPFQSVIRVPSTIAGQVSIFHTSFHDFIVDSARSKRYCLDGSESHQLLANKCLQCLNKYLRYNICSLPEDTIGSQSHVINDISVIPQSLQYACLHWASHLATTLDDPPADSEHTVYLLSDFADGHLLHWFECLSAMGQLESGVRSLRKGWEAISKFSETRPEFRCIAALFDDARRCLQMGFEAIQLHCLNTYYSALTWIPRRSIIREHYKQSLYAHRVLGLSEPWGPLEHVMHHPSSVSSVAISRDGSWIVSGSDAIIRVWSATTGGIELELRGHLSWVHAVAFSFDGSLFVTGSEDQTVGVWRVADWQMEHILEGHSDALLSVAFSPDGTRVVSGSRDQTVRVWTTDMGKIQSVLEGHSGEVRSVAFLHDGSRIASGSEDHTICIWDAHTGETIRVLRGHSHCVRSVAFSTDGSRLASGSWDKTARIWDTHTWGTIHVLENHLVVFAVAFSADGSYLVSGSGSVGIWKVSTGELEHDLKGHQDAVKSVAFSCDGSRVVSGSIDRTVRTWNMETQRVLEDLSQLVDDHTRRIWHTVRVTSVMESYIVEPDSDDVTCLAFSLDGSRIVSSSRHTLRLWRASTAEIEHVLQGHLGWVRCIAFSPCGRRIVSGSTDNTVRIWSTITGEEERILKGHSNLVSCVAYSPCGGHVVSGSDDTTVRIWNAATGEEERVLSGHSDNVLAVAFSHDRSRVASGSRDCTVRIWAVATGEAVCRLKGHPHWVTCVAFTHDDRRFVSSAYDGTIKIWDVTAREFNESSQLLDGSRVNALRKGQSQILDPVDQDITTQASLSSDLKWLLGGSGTHDCWIAAEYRNRIMALSGSKACIGYDGQRVVIVDLATRS